MNNSTNEEDMYLYVGTYNDEKSANADYDALVAMHHEGVVGNYDAGIVYKNSDGKLDIKRHTNFTGKGTRRGLAVGVLLGIVFPPSIIATSVVGLGAGAAIGHAFNGISRDDLKLIGAYLEDSEAALVIIAESTLEEMIGDLPKMAIKEYRTKFSDDAMDHNEALKMTLNKV